METGSNAFSDFYALMDKYVVKGDKFYASLAPTFHEELKEISLHPEQPLRYFWLYWEELFILQNSSFARVRIPLPPGMNLYDYALKVYVQVFGEMFDKLYSSDPGYIVGGRRKQDFVAFLCGITDSLHNDDERIRTNYHNIAESDEPILIGGETGTGKELHAKLFHYLSLRREQPFLALNCSGIPEELLESQLFGYEKGTFTGAISRMDGILQSVGEGTLFLDEIGDMSPNLQAKILRVLQTRDYFRVGEYRKSEIFKGRVIAATHRDLEAEIKKDKPTFRPDLYYRIAVYHLRLAPFRDLSPRVRSMKIDNLINRIYSSYDMDGKKEKPFDLPIRTTGYQETNYQILGPIISEETRELLLKYNYPGNYRELINIIKFGLLTSGGAIKPENLPPMVLNHQATVTDPSKQEPDRFFAKIESTKLKDILLHAEEVKKSIIEEKVRQIYREGKNLKNTLRSEGIKSESGYVNFRKKVVGILGPQLWEDAKQNPAKKEV